MKPVILPKNPDNTVQLRPGVDFTGPGQIAPWHTQEHMSQRSINDILAGPAQALVISQGPSPELREQAERQRASESRSSGSPWNPPQWPLGSV